MNIIGKKVKFSTNYEGKGIVIGISTEYQELSNGIGQFPVFIILKEDGKIDNISTNCCEIIKED